MCFQPLISQLPAFLFKTNIFPNSLREESPVLVARIQVEFLAKGGAVY